MITSPFNFVPISDKVFFPNWSEQVSHDIPFKDGEDGIITLEITNHTPMFVRDGHAKGTETDWSCHIPTEDGKKKYFIPGTTLKGCFRSVFEILSFSKMNFFDDTSFGYRSFHTKVNDQYMQNMKRVKCCGWLYRADDENYCIDECLKGIQKIKHRDIKDHVSETFNSGKDHCTAEMKQKSLGKDLYPGLNVSENQIFYKEASVEKKVPEGSYRVVCTGYMGGKTPKSHEYLFSEDCKTIAVSQNVFKTFDSVHKVTPYYGGTGKTDGFLRKRLMEGERIPVFFEKGKDGEVVAMGITRNFKYPFQNSVRQCVQHISKEHFLPDLDLTEIVFGYTNEDTQLKGRVQFGHAFATKDIKDEDCVKIKGVLGQPQASYYPLYLKQSGKTYTNYNSDNAQIAGRKRYRISKDAATWSPGQGNDNEAVQTQFNLLPKKQTFICKVRVHNLKHVEIGALLSAFTFNETSGTFHNLGLAKSFGYGSFTCKVSLSDDFKLTAKDYIEKFNEEMSFFLQEHNSSLAQDVSLKRLVEIASATHTESEMKQMDLDAYSDHKQDTNFSLLKETPKNFSVLVDEGGIVDAHKRREVENKMEFLVKLPKKEAIEKLVDLRLENIVGNDALADLGQKILDKIKELEQALQDEEAAEQAKADAKQADIDATIKAEDRAKGLSLLLKCNNKSVLNISTLSEGIKRIDQFLKKHKPYTFTLDDSNYMKEWLHAIPVPKNKKEQADFKSFEGASWKRLCEWFGKDVVKEWFDSATNR
ncbi:MAG: TIGR03986 family CRISPR-associated RAMP protein [Bacteroidaceae bacterium]|nr:TIGR03986 family CRISPR-associated RAMP protein [Bacteroidaceae bacterium]